MRLNTSFQNTNCLTCTDSLVVDNLFAQTWHDGLQAVQGTPVSLSLSFTGTGISVMCAAIDLGPRTDIVTPMDLAFTLDGQPHGTYLYPQTGKAVYVYNYTFDDQPATSSTLSTPPTTAVVVSTQVTTSTATAVGTAVINTLSSTGSTDTVFQSSTSISTVGPQSPSSVNITSRSITSHGSQSTPSSSASSSASATVSSALLPTASTGTSPEVSPPATGIRRKNTSMIGVVIAVCISVVALAAIFLCMRYRRHRTCRTSTEDQERTPVPYTTVQVHSAGSLQSLLSPNRLGSGSASAGGTHLPSALASTADVDSGSMLDPPPSYAERMSSHVVVASPALGDRGAPFEMRKPG
ncbi:unnamed protein product [Mycena citricolor]|uniref:Uncharacterized protein n=1 Tax=Mycena citricolor TaxID=2018698 RepID=A0AAD2H9D3_9AGAR|nr:unnamed protein product [Mycena citricolor]